jgi:hypothetical protein
MTIIAAKETGKIISVNRKGFILLNTTERTNTREG